MLFETKQQLLDSNFDSLVVQSQCMIVIDQ